MRGRFILDSKSIRPPSSVVLVPGTQILGRSSSCEIVVKNRSVSRRHAEIVVVDSTVTVTDLGSRNGTYVNERRISCWPVVYGQQLRFGMVVFELVAETHQDPDARCALLAETEFSVADPVNASTVDIRLSGAQQRVLGLLAEGIPEKAIARRLRLSRHTVHNHIRGVYRAFGIHTRIALIAHLYPLKGQSWRLGARRAQSSDGPAPA